MELIEVSGTARRVTYEITPEDAEKITQWYSEVGDENGGIPEVRQLMAPLWAIAGRREYGGH